MRDQMEFERVQMEQTNVLQHLYGVTSCTLCGRTDCILADEHTRTKQCVLCGVTDESYCDACFLPWNPQWKDNMNLVQYTTYNSQTVLQLESDRELLCYHCIADNEYDLEITTLLSECRAEQLERVLRQADETGGFPPIILVRSYELPIPAQTNLAASRSHAADKARGSTILPLLRAEATEGVLPWPAGFVEVELDSVSDQDQDQDQDQELEEVN